jgi:hypothetical protein
MKQYKKNNTREYPSMSIQACNCKDGSMKFTDKYDLSNPAEPNGKTYDAFNCYGCTLDPPSGITRVNPIINNDEAYLWPLNPFRNSSGSEADACASCALVPPGACQDGCIPSKDYEYCTTDVNDNIWNKGFYPDPGTCLKTPDNPNNCASCALVKPGFCQEGCPATELGLKNCPVAPFTTTVLKGTHPGKENCFTIDEFKAYNKLVGTGNMCESCQLVDKDNCQENCLKSSYKGGTRNDCPKGDKNHPNYSFEKIPKLGGCIGKLPSTTAVEYFDLFDKSDKVPTLEKYPLSSGTQADACASCPLVPPGACQEGCPPVAGGVGDCGYNKAPNRWSMGIYPDPGTCLKTPDNPNNCASCALVKPGFCQEGCAPPTETPGNKRCKVNKYGIVLDGTSPGKANCFTIDEFKAYNKLVGKETMCESCQLVNSHNSQENCPGSRWNKITRNESETLYGIYNRGQIPKKDGCIGKLPIHENDFVISDNDQYFCEPEYGFSCDRKIPAGTAIPGKLKNKVCTDPYLGTGPMTACSAQSCLDNLKPGTVCSCQNDSNPYPYSVGASNKKQSCSCKYADTGYFCENKSEIHKKTDAASIEIDKKNNAASILTIQAKKAVATAKALIEQGKKALTVAEATLNDATSRKTEYTKIREGAKIDKQTICNSYDRVGPCPQKYDAIINDANTKINSASIEISGATITIASQEEAIRIAKKDQTQANALTLKAKNLSDAAIAFAKKTNAEVIAFSKANTPKPAKCPSSHPFNYNGEGSSGWSCCDKKICKWSGHCPGNSIDCPGAQTEHGCDSSVETDTICIRRGKHWMEYPKKECIDQFNNLCPPPDNQQNEFATPESCKKCVGDYYKGGGVNYKKLLSATCTHPSQLKSLCYQRDLSAACSNSNCFDPKAWNGYKNGQVQCCPGGPDNNNYEDCCVSCWSVDTSDPKYADCEELTIPPTGARVCVGKKCAIMSSHKDGWSRKGGVHCMGTRAPNGYVTDKKTGTCVPPPPPVKL